MVIQRVLRREARIAGTATRQMAQCRDTADAGGPDTDRLQRVQHRLPRTISCRSAGKQSDRIRAVKSMWKILLGALQLCIALIVLPCHAMCKKNT